MFKIEITNQRSILLKSIIALILFVASASSVSANEYYHSTSRLNVRTGPGVDYSVSFTLDKYDEIQVIDKKGKWYKVNYNGQIGYVSSRFLAFSRSTSNQNNIFTKLIDKKIGFGFLLLLVTAIIIYFSSGKNSRVNKKSASTQYITKAQHTLQNNRTQCPKCNSTSIYVAKKGFSGNKAFCGAILLGPLGLLCGNHKSKQIYSTCLNCNYSW